MSRQSFEAFMTTLQKDAELQKELRKKLGDPAQGVSAEGLNKFAAGKGYDFKIEEIQGELSEKQLNTVAGGVLGSSFEFLKSDDALQKARLIKFDCNFYKI